MNFPNKRSDLYAELVALGYTESTRIDSPNQVLLAENKGIVRNTITLKGSGITAMTGLTNQNPSIVVKSPTELTTYNLTYPKTSSLALDAGLVDDVKLNQYIVASGIDASLFISPSLYSIEVTVAGDIKIHFTDIFDEGLILLPLVDGKAYQLDQLDKLGAATDPVLKFATGKSFTKANVLANRKVVPGKPNTYFIPLVLKVKAVGEFPNFTVGAVEPDQSLVNYLAIGPNEIASSPLTVGWMGVNAITDTQFRPSVASPLKVELGIRQFKVSELALTYASTAIITALKAISSNSNAIVDYAQYTNTILSPNAENRTMDIVYAEDYDVNKTKVLQVYQMLTPEVSALNDTLANNDPVVLTLNNVNYKASELLNKIVEVGGKFYIGFENTISEIPTGSTFSFNVGGLDNPNTEWTEVNWTTTVTQTLPKALVIPVTVIPNKAVQTLSTMDGGYKLGIKHMRLEFNVPANQKFAYGFSDVSTLTIVDESDPAEFEVVKATSTVAIRNQVLPAGKIVRNKTNAVAKLKLYVQVPMDAVNQSVGSNYLDEMASTLGATVNLVTSELKGNGNYSFFGLQGTNDTVDTLGYSHRYQKLITANQAIKFKYNSLLAPSISFGTAVPLNHTDVTLYNSSVISEKQSKVLITSDGYVFKVSEAGFNQVDRIDIREGVYIEAAVDEVGTGLVITQLQYANDDLTKTPFILNISKLPEILSDITGGISVHVSGIGLANNATIYLTDIYDVVKVVPIIECAGSTNAFETNIASSTGATVQVNDGTVQSWADWKEENGIQIINDVLSIESKDYRESTRIRIRDILGFITRDQLEQANSAYVIYDKFGNVIDTELESNFSTVEGKSGIVYGGMDICLSTKPYPEILCDGALDRTEEITITGEVNAMVNGVSLSDGPVDVNELKTLLAPYDIEVIIVEE